MYDITIKAALNGWICQVGCQALVFESKEKMLGEINRYLEMPESVEKEYREHAVNARLLPLNTGPGIAWNVRQESNAGRDDGTQ